VRAAPESRLATTRVTSRAQGLYINLGYWKDARCVDDACVAMVQLLAETIQLSADDVVLDVGFGFGEQDVYWMERFGPRRNVGINIVHRSGGRGLGGSGGTATRAG
jgi:hypothetical protein